MDEREFKKRTKQLALRVIHLTEALPPTRTADVIGRQLLRSGTSIAANYRAACRAKSRADMASKLSTVEEEADESLYWMELLIEAHIVKEAQVTNLMHETEDILKLTVSSIRTLRGTRHNPKSEIENPK